MLRVQKRGATVKKERMEGKGRRKQEEMKTARVRERKKEISDLSCELDLTIIQTGDWRRPNLDGRSLSCNDACN